MTQKPQTERLRRRKEMTDDIIQQVRNAVQDEVAGAPESISFDELERIEQNVMSHTQLVVDALGYEEMQSEGALLTHIANARSETNKLLRDRRSSS